MSPFNPKLYPFRCVTDGASHGFGLLVFFILSNACPPRPAQSFLDILQLFVVFLVTSFDL